MPAKRHGRSGKAHRPLLDDSPFDDVARDPRAHPAMKELAALAARRGLSPRGFAKLAGREPESLMRSFYAASPRLKTVEVICDCLRLERRVARALLERLDSRDAKGLRSLVAEAIEGRGRQSFGRYAPTTALEVLAWLEREPASVTLDVGRRCVLALYSLGSPDVDADVALLGPVVGAIVTSLRANGYNVFPFLHWQQSEEAKDALALEAQAWTHLLCEAVGFEELIYFGRKVKAEPVPSDNPKAITEPTAPEDSKALHSLVGPHLKRGGAAYLTKRAKRPGYDVLDLDALQRFNRAKMAAKRAFRETFYSSEKEKQS